MPQKSDDDGSYHHALIEQHGVVDWLYPNIYATDPSTGAKTALSRLVISMSHARAANDIIIEYDGERDGYSIRMDRTRSDGDDMEVMEEAVEVAFIPAWNEEPTAP